MRKNWNNEIKSEPGFTRLICEIFRITSQDIRVGNDTNREEALLFINSSLFTDICDELNLDPNRVKYLMLNNKVKERRTY